MLKTQNLPVVDALNEVLETMAFIFPQPLDKPAEAPENPMLVSIGFTGLADGTLELVAGEAFAALIAANILGASCVDQDMNQCAGDAIKELVNVICGSMLSKTAPTSAEGSSHRIFEMDLPKLTSFDVIKDWQTFTTTFDATVVDADGHIVADLQFLFPFAR